LHLVEKPRLGGVFYCPIFSFRKVQKIPDKAGIFQKQY